MVDVTATPAISSKVGYKSKFCTRASHRVPGAMRSGYRMTSGTR